MTRTTYAYWVRGRAFAELAAKSIESIKRFDRFMVDRRFVILTDTYQEVFAELSRLHDRSGIVVDMEKKERPSMVSNLDAQIACLMGTPMGERVLFLDADTLMLQPFPWTDADIHATYRHEINGDVEMARQQPWNYGVLGVNVTPAVIESFIWLRQRILKMSTQHQQWYGNQLALFDLLGAARESRYETSVRWTLQDRGTPLSVQPLPCDIWNWTPNGPEEPIEGKGIIHCKGNRKDLIEHYAGRIAA